MNELFQQSTKQVSSINPEGCQMILQAVESFFNETPGGVVEYLESMLYDWYQYSHQDRYRIEQVNEYVNVMFRVNDLLLKLTDAMAIMKEEA
jgi:hypothetical protein